ncbi:MAG: efflux transporter outer membrane subunit [Gammaproteobacteria bacterium]|nr:efflux transporter outer membrane subunit [Gammaproteobacteria bacterium]
MKILNFSVLASALLLTACSTVGPDYRAPTIEPVTFTVESDVQTVSYDRQWWQRFDDPILSQLVDITLTNNKSLAAAQANIDRALAQFSDIDNDSLPSGTLDLSYQESKSLTPGSGIQQYQNRYYQGGANINWQLDLAGKLRRATESALANAQSTQSELHALQVEIISNLVSVYADYRGTQHQLTVAKRNVLILGELAQLVKIRQQEGLASELELTRILAQQSAVKASIEQLASTLKLTEYDLALLSGQRANALTVDLSEQDIPQLNGPVAIGDVGQLLLRRPDVRAAERRLAASTASIGVATADLYPQVNVSGFLGFITGQSTELSSNTGAWSIVPSISWQGLNWASVEARIDAANAQQRQMMAQYQQQLLVAVNQAQSSLTAYSYSQRRLHHLAAQRVASERAMTLATAQYRSGLSDLLSLLDTERSLLAAQDTYAQAQAQVMKDLVAIYRSFGGAIGQPTAG